jgi:hypothetical protein
VIVEWNLWALDGWAELGYAFEFDVFKFGQVGYVGQIV